MKDIFMWRENLEALKIKVGTSHKSIGDGIGRSERTIARVFSKRFEDHKRGHSLDLIQSIVEFLGGNMSDIFKDTATVIAGESYIQLQEKLDVVTAERDWITSENAVLKEKVAALTSENELLKIQLMHKEEIIALHNYYNKLNPNKKGDDL
jgi:hypothetical protein